MQGSGRAVEAAAADGGRGGRGGSTRAGADAERRARRFSRRSPASSLGTEGTRGAEPPPSSSSPKSYGKADRGTPRPGGGGGATAPAPAPGLRLPSAFGDFDDAFLDAFAGDFAGDSSGEGSRGDSRGDLEGVTTRRVGRVGVLPAAPEDDASPASPRRGVPAGDFAYVAWRSTSDIRRGVSAPVPSLTRTPDRGCRVAPGTSSYGERCTRDRVGVGVVRTVAGRNGDGGGRPNVPAVDVGVPEVLRALGVGLPAPDALDVGIAPDRAPASRERARLRPAPQTPGNRRTRDRRCGEPDTSDKSNKRPFGKTATYRRHQKVFRQATSSFLAWTFSAPRGARCPPPSRPAARPISSFASPRARGAPRSRPRPFAAHAVAGVFFVFRGLETASSAELAAAKRAVLEAVDGTSRGLRDDGRGAAERAISALERLTRRPRPPRARSRRAAGR